MFQKMDINVTYFHFLISHAAIFNFYDAKRLPNCFKQKKVTS